jgi:4-hydroxy-3-polyprenylbenzoate decarboxylase
LPKKIIIALTGASGIIYGVETLKVLFQHNIETHVVISKWAQVVLTDETAYSLEDLQKYIFKAYNYEDMSASIASSSMIVDGMIIIPSTVKTVSNIANGYTGDLISRAADNMLKMRKKVIIGIRETPLSPPCLHNLAKLASYGAIILPLSPGFYHKPQQLQDLYDFITGKVLDCLNIPNQQYLRWKEKVN